MIVNHWDAVARFSPVEGVTSRILVSGEKAMFLLIDLQPGSVIPFHSHPHEQAGVCLRGRVEFETEKGPVVVEANTAYLFASNEQHGAKVLSAEGATVLEVFSPPREDYLAQVQK
jgi:quercetin dioxygenase-like cupin family protein